MLTLVRYTYVICYINNTFLWLIKSALWHSSPTVLASYLTKLKVAIAIAHALNSSDR